MRVFYFLLLAVACAACADGDSQQAQSAGSTPLRQVAPPLPAPAVPPAGLAAPVSPASQAHQPQPLASRRAHQPARFRRSRPKTPPPADLPGSFTTDYAAPALAPDSLSFGAAKAAQRFWVSPGRDTVLYGAEGTTIWVPAQAFAVARADAPAVMEQVEVRLKEFYTLPDILLNNLSTASSQGLLETGGMLHLEARTANGQLCTLREGTELLLRMPAAQPKPGMQLYTGVRTAQHGLDWQTPVKQLERKVFIGFGPEARNELTLQKQLRQGIGYNAGMAQQLQGQARSRQQRKALRRHARYTGRRFLEYGILFIFSDDKGVITGAMTQGIQDTMLAEHIRNAALRLPAFQPAYLLAPAPPRKPGKRNYLETPRRQRSPVAAPGRPRLPVAGYWALRIGFTSKGRVWIPWSGWGEVNLGQNPALQSFDSKVAQQRIKQANAADLQATSLDSLGGYLFSAARLGWTNCDQPAQFAGRRIRFGIETDAPHTRVNLVFRRVRAVVPSDGEQPGSRQQFFHSAPANEPATIVALRREAGITYLAIKNIVLQEGIEKGLDFRPATPAELRAALAAITP